MFSKILPVLQLLNSNPGKRPIVYWKRTRYGSRVQERNREIYNKLKEAGYGQQRRVPGLVDSIAEEYSIVPNYVYLIWHNEKKQLENK